MLFFQKIQKLLSKKIGWLIPILLIPAIWSLFVPGWGGLSDDMHVAWLHQMVQTFLAGKWPPRYVPDLSFGFGYPLFNFVFPMPFYLGSLFYFLGLTLVDSLKAVFGVSLVASFASMYFLLKHLSNKWLALIGAIVYVYTPYRATDVYVRGAVGESLAFVFFPLIVLAVLRAGKNIEWLGVGSLGVAGLILSHNITAMMFIPLAFILALMLKSNLKVYLLFLLGLLVSLYFWFPAIWDSKLMQYATVFDAKDHFPTIKQLITPHFGWGASVPGPYDGMSFFLGLPNLLLMALGAGLIITRKKTIGREKEILLLWAMSLMAVSIFMMNYRSSILWDNLPLLPYFQFPWRFLALMAFASSLLAIFLKELKGGVWFGVILIVIATLFGAKYFRFYKFNGWSDSFFLNRYIPVPEASFEYHQTGEEYLRLPLGTNVRPDQNFPRFFSEQKMEVGNLIELNALEAKATISSKEALVVSYNRYLFPGWRVYIDGQEVKIMAGEPYGQIAFDVGFGTHQVEIVWRETRRNKILDFVSLFALVVSGWLVVHSKERNEK